MSLPDFKYLRPRTLDLALSLLALASIFSEKSHPTVT